jgi:hypothetical protein
MPDIGIVLGYHYPCHYSPQIESNPSRRVVIGVTGPDLETDARGYARRVIDSNLPRFSQGVQAVVLALAFLLDWRIAVPILGAVLLAAVAGGPRYNLLARLYRAFPIPRGEPEPAAPPRFAQTLGVTFLVIGSIGLFTAEPETTAWWVVGWGPALVVALLSGVAATSSF